jgi:outer membrane receptor for ferrienterochelin and colicins
VVVDATYDYPIPLAGGRRVVVGAIARNLTNAYQADLDRGADRDSGYVYGPRFPRSVSLRLRVEF